MTTTTTTIRTPTTTTITTTIRHGPRHTASNLLIFGGILLIVALLAGCSGITTVDTADTAGGMARVGTGISPWPVCTSTPARPGQATALTNGGIDTPRRGIEVTNRGSGPETITVTVTPVQRGEALYGHGHPVPANWVRIVGSPATVAPGVSVWHAVTVTVPPGTPDGTYVADLTAVGGTGGPNGIGIAQFSPAVTTYLVFDVGLARPDWPATVLGVTDPCWAPPGHYESWQQWSHTAIRPPGWHWSAPMQYVPAAWRYTPPPGWSWSWANPNDPHPVYTGARPVAACITARQITANGWGSGAPGGGPWIGGPDHPDTSTAAGCRTWLHQ